MAWFYLFLAGILEVVWAYTMKLSNGFSKPVESGLTIVAMIASFVLLALSMKTLPLSVSYVIWTGIGGVGAFLVGTFLLGEEVSGLKIIAALLIVTGIILMKISTK